MRQSFGHADLATLIARVVLAALVAVPRVLLAQDDAGGSADPDPSPQTGAIPAAPDPQPTRRRLTDAIRSFMNKFDKKDGHNDGWYLELSNMITGAGWVSLGPGYRKYFLNEEAYADVSGAASWHLYKMVQGRVEAPDLTKAHVALGAQLMWQDNTQVRYFGTGEDSLEGNESLYRMRSTDLVGYASFRPVSSFTIGGAFGWLPSPDLSSPAGTFKPNLPTTFVVFPTDPGVTPSDQPGYLHSEIAATNDTRDHRGHPTSGGLYRVAMATYHDQRDGLFTFRQYQAEALHFAPLTGPEWMLVLHGWLVVSDVATGREVPFYLLPTLGGSNTLRSFSDYRFHDLNSLVYNVESRWTIRRHVDLAVFGDAGNVAPHADALDLEKVSLGAGVRLFTDHTTFARFDVAHGSDGWQFVFRTNDPFRFSRIRRHIADLPFVP